jgi:purine-binding chemotaxis protein CheW
MAARRRFCTFWLGELYYGLDVLRVQEIVGHQQPTRVPLAPPAVRGLINLRGRIVTALDLRRRLGLAEAPAGLPPKGVVVRTDEGVVSLLVDEVGDVREVEEAAFERPLENLEGEARELIQGAYKLPGRLLLILEVDKVLEVPAGTAGPPRAAPGGRPLPKEGAECDG